MSKAILAKRKAEAEQRKRKEDEAIRKLLSKCKDTARGDSAPTWGRKMNFGKGT